MLIDGKKLTTTSVGASIPHDLYSTQLEFTDSVLAHAQVSTFDVGDAARDLDSDVAPRFLHHLTREARDVTFS